MSDQHAPNAPHVVAGIKGVPLPREKGRAGAATVSILDDAELARRFGNAAQPSLDGSNRMVALVLATKSVAQARTRLDRAGIPHAPYDTGIVVGAEYAAGVAVAFVG